MLSCFHHARRHSRRHRGPRVPDARRAAPVLAPAHVRRHLRDRRRLHVGHLQRRAARTCADRPADSSRPAARVDEPAVLGSSARRVGGRSDRARRLHAAAARRGAGPVRHRAAARRGARRLRTGPALRRRSAGRGAGGPGVCRLGLHRVPTQTPEHRLHGCLAARRTAADRSRAWRRRAPRTPTRARRALFMAAFGLVFAEQVLSGFPQSAYICALVYGSFALFRAIVDRQRPVRCRAAGAARRPRRLRPCSARPPARSCCFRCPSSAAFRIAPEALGWEWSTAPAYWPPNVLTFLVPYIHGDISDYTYVGHSIFWEDYGYVGAATFLLALYGGVRERRRPLVAVLDPDDARRLSCSCSGRRRRRFESRTCVHSGDEAVSLSHPFPDRRGAGSRAPRGRRADTPRRGSEARC